MSQRKKRKKNVDRSSWYYRGNGNGDRFNEPEGELLLIFPEWKPVILGAARGPRRRARWLQVARMVNITTKCKSYCYSRRAPSLSLSISLFRSRLWVLSTVRVRRPYSILVSAGSLIGFGYYVSWPRTDCLRPADTIPKRYPQSTATLFHVIVDVQNTF